MNEKMNGHENQVFVPKNRKQSKVKRIVAQLFVTAAFGMMVLSVGTLLTSPTILNGALYSETRHMNSTSSPSIEPFNFTYEPSSFENATRSELFNQNEMSNYSETEGSHNKSATNDIELNSVQAYWLGGVMYVVQPVGSIVSGFIQNHIGRRNGMMATSVVQLIGWLSLYFSINIPSLFAAAVLMGLSIGFMEAPGLSFLGEVIEPIYRGFFANISMNMWLFGTMLEYLLGATLDWRYACLASAAVPIINFLMLLMIPESPTFLLLQGKDKQAESALRWLRGWTEHDVIKDEYEALMESLNVSKKRTKSAEDKGSETKSKGQLSLLLERRVRFPIMVIAFMFLTQHCISLSGLRPFLVHIFKSQDVEFSPHWILVCSSLLQLVGVAICTFSITRTGKRMMLMISGFSSSTVCLLLTIYMFIQPKVPIIAIVLFAVNFFLNGLGIMSLPWCLVCEVFPPECRGSAAGIAAASSYVIGFITTITYKPLEQHISLWGCLLIYTIIGYLGTIFIYFKLPETEGKSLDEIQQLFRCRSELRRSKQSKDRYY